MNEVFTCGICGTKTNGLKYPVCKNKNHIVNCCHKCWEKNNENYFNEFIEYYKKKALSITY